MLRLLLVFVFIPLALVGCGKSTAQESQDAANDGNAKIARMNDISKSVLSSYGVGLITNTLYSTEKVATLNTTTVEKLSTSQLKSLQALVTEFRSLSGDVLGIIDSGKVFYVDRDTISRAATNADNVLSAIATSLAASKDAA